MDASKTKPLMMAFFLAALSVCAQRFIEDFAGSWRNYLIFSVDLLVFLIGFAVTKNNAFVVAATNVFGVFVGSLIVYSIYFHGFTNTPAAFVTFLNVYVSTVICSLAATSLVVSRWIFTALCKYA